MASAPEEWVKQRQAALDAKAATYEKVDDGFKCKACGAHILGAKVAHPIHDGPFPMSGFGECLYDQEPYCPNCEEKPSFHGAPITIPFKPVRSIFDRLLGR